MSRHNIGKDILDAKTFCACRPLIGQIAHDYNNLLTPLLAYPGLIKYHLSNPSYSDMLDAIEKAARDMIHINEQLMLLSSNGSHGQMESSVIDIINAALLGLKESPRYYENEMDLQIADDLPPVSVNMDLIAHGLLNLIMNALEAATPSPSISIIADIDNVDAEHPLAAEAPFAGKFIRITVKDNGPGFSADMIDKAAIPFVTTKKEQGRRGAGLGLSTAFTICRDHGGFMAIENSPTGGAEVSLFLPPIFKEAAMPETEVAQGAQSDVHPQGAPVPCTSNRILLVDDEATIVKLFQMIITSSIPDCTVDTAPNGQEALKEFEKHHHSVIVMDLHMPVMDGQSAFNEIHKIAETRHWMPPAVVFCTGFAPPDMVHRIVSTSSKHCLLSKPVRGEILVDAIRSRLS